MRTGFPSEQVDSRPQCPYCGERFAKLRDGKIPTHDFPKPARAVCRGSGEEPKQHDDTPLWKDDPQQQERDFYDAARQELLLYGFAIVKAIGKMRGKPSGKMKCPLCGGAVRYRIAPNNGHCAAKCMRDAAFR
jgi:uncharacterized Zn-finger protein